MYMVAFMYPSRDHADFNFAHFVDVHLPMGLALTRKHLNLVPKKILIYSQTRKCDADGRPPYGAISSVFFDTLAEAERFAGLFGVEEAARLLSEDFRNYTPAPPEIMLARVTELTDMEKLIEAHYSAQSRGA
jgi:hypothetical protein